MAKRLSLREYQQRIIDRIQIQQKGGAVDNISTLGIQVGKDNWLVEMQEIAEVLPLPDITPVRLTQPWFRGVANIRGNLYSISDLAAFMGLGETTASMQSRVLLVNPKFSCNAGLVVSRVLGLRDTKNWQYRATEGDAHYLDEQGQLWHKLDVGQLMLQPDFLQIGV